MIAAGRWQAIRGAITVWIPLGKSMRVGVVVLVLSATTAAGAAHVGTPPRALWSRGYDLCKAIPLHALRTAGRQPYGAGGFAGQVCTWERADRRAGVTLATETGSPGFFREYFARVTSLGGHGGITEQTVSVPGARRAVIETVPERMPGGTEVTRTLYAEFTPGLIRLAVQSPGPSTNATVLSLMRLVAG